MDLSALPDIIGMLILMSILGWARRHYGAKIVNLWLMGLALVLLGDVPAALGLAAHPWTKLAALDSTVLAGMFFALAGGPDQLSARRLLLLVGSPVGALFVLASGSALGLNSTRFFLVVIALALLSGPLWLSHAECHSPGLRRTLLAASCAVWLPMLLLVRLGQIDSAVAWGLGSLYLAVAASFLKDVRRDGAGGLVLVTGFSTWSACLFLHPLAPAHPAVGAFLARVLGMQKFFVILGMLLVLLETETRLRRREAMHDALTGLPNRRLFEDRLAQALERSRRSGLTVALVTLDLNGFKQINDTLGHHHGDLVLKATAEHLRARVRVSDTLSRCGGDEFSIIMGDIARPEDCARVVENLREAVAHQIDPRYSITCSIGFALFPQEADDAETLAELADRRMYQNKRAQTAPPRAGSLDLILGRAV